MVTHCRYCNAWLISEDDWHNCWYTKSGKECEIMVTIDKVEVKWDSPTSVSWKHEVKNVRKELEKQYS